MIHFPTFLSQKITTMCYFEFFSLENSDNSKAKVYNQITKKLNPNLKAHPISVNQQQQQMMQDMNANSYLILLIMMEIAMLTFSLLGQFSVGAYFVAVRVLFLVMAQCCKRPSSAAFYSVLALMNAFYSFDPVGLFITGHGQIRTLSANIFCVIACGLAFLTSYIGYHYKLALENQHHEGQEVNNNPSFLYGGNNTGYINPNDGQNRNPYSQAGTRSFQPFQGQGHALG